MVKGFGVLGVQGFRGLGLYLSAARFGKGTSTMNQLDRIMEALRVFKC